MYIANERLKLGVDDYRMPGDPVPEADGWPWQLRESYLRNARIRLVPDPPDQAATLTARPAGRAMAAPAPGSPDSARDPSPERGTHVVQVRAAAVATSHAAATGAAAPPRRSHHAPRPAHVAPTPTPPATPTPVGAHAGGAAPKEGESSG
jgi:hypothetical protein